MDEDEEDGNGDSGGAGNRNRLNQCSSSSLLPVLDPSAVLEIVGEWLFDDGDLLDTSGNDYHGATNGAAYVTETNTGTGKAINLNGNKYVNVDDGQNQTVFDGGTKFSISAWVKEEPDGGWEPWISKRGEGGKGWQLRRAGSN